MHLMSQGMAECRAAPFAICCVEASFALGEVLTVSGNEGTAPLQSLAPRCAQEHWRAHLCALQVRRVLGLIRGETYEKAIMVLTYTPYRSCEPILKCLLSVSRATSWQLVCWAASPIG